MEDYMNLGSISAAIDEMESIHHRQNNPAEHLYKRIMQRISAQESRLSDKHELGVYVTGGGAPSFHLRGISYSNPDILIFVGKDSEGNAVQLLQHHTQMSVMILAMPKLDETPYRIGFTAK